MNSEKKKTDRSDHSNAEETQKECVNDLEVTDEQADQARAGAGAGQLSQPEYKYVSVRR